MKILKEGWYGGLGGKFSIHYFKKSTEAKSRCGQIRKELVNEKKLNKLMPIPKNKAKRCGSCEMLLKADTDMETFVSAVHRY